MDTLTAARGQMALSLMFHMVFAATGIGLPLLLVLAEGAYLRTGREHYLKLAKQWAKATSLFFAVGAVSGTALSFELGLLWPQYMELTGAVVGHIFALEGYAFFVEAIFIGLYLYGWQKLSPRVHWWCGVVIAISGMLSGVFILGVNAWMQVPVGFAMDEAGRVVTSNPFAIFRQYAWFTMALHSTLACYIAVPFAIAGIYAAGLLRGKHDDYHRSAVRLCLATGAVAALIQPISGDQIAKFVYRTQKAKFAAMEGQFETQRYAPLRIGGVPDEESGATRYAIEIPGGLSFLATYDPATEVQGLNDIPREDWPNVALTHAAFQIMVGSGVLLMILSIWFWLMCWLSRQSVYDRRWLMRAVVAAGPLGFIALQAGWVVTEVGRQPWVIQGIMRTSDAVTTAPGVPVVFAGFTLLYLMLAAVVVFVLLKLRGGKHGY